MLRLLFWTWTNDAGAEPPAADTGRKLISPALIAHPSLTT